MKAGILTIGSEIISGNLLNTNSRFIAFELENIGFEPLYHLSVKDEISEIHSGLEKLIKNCDLIIVTGGLGPTPDDLTHEAIAKYFNKKLEKDPKEIKNIKQKFKLRGYKTIPKINFKQAYKPQDAKWIKNKIGTANGIILKIRGENFKYIFTFPGVPSEMKKMWEENAKPYLKNLKGKEHTYSTILKFTGIGESFLAEKIKKYLYLKNPTVATYAELGEIKVKLRAVNKNKEKAKRSITKIANKIISKTKKYYFGKDSDTLESIVAKKLIQSKKTIAVCESCTGGLLAKRLTDIPGSSKYFLLSYTTYSNSSKSTVLGIKDSLIKKYGAVSKQVASKMAIGIKKLAKVDIGISITGIAGPSGGTKAKPIGLVYFGLAIGNKVQTKKVLFGSNRSRDEIRFLATQFALNWLRKELRAKRREVRKKNFCKLNIHCMS